MANNNYNIKPLVSFIIPCYNAEQYIGMCIQSILNQNEKSFEIIIVDDGSVDKSVSICKEFSNNDKRIRLITQSNKGPSSARNKGLTLAKGEWISFIDADDWIDTDFCEDLQAVKNADIIYFGFKDCLPDKTIRKQIQSQSSLSEIGVDKIYAELISSKEQFFGYTWNKFFKNNIIQEHKIFFPENIIHKEDEIFSLRYSHHVKSIFISNKTSYNYRKHPKSVTHNPNFIYDWFKLGKYIEREISLSYHDALIKEFNKRLNVYFDASVTEEIHSSLFKKTYDNYIDFCRANSTEIKLSRRWKLFMYLPKNVGSIIFKWKYS